MKQKTSYFLKIFKLAEKKYGKDPKRLAAEDWKEHWQTLFSTIMSAQTRDETTIPVAEKLFEKYPTLKSIVNAKFEDILSTIKGVNYNRTKAKHLIEAAKYLLENHDGKVPDSIDELIKIPGVGRKTANIIITECYHMDGICVDTHVHRISNVFGFVKTKNPTETEFELMKIVPRKYWSRINRIFVLWGKQVTGHNKQKFLDDLKKK